MPISRDPRHRSPITLGLSGVVAVVLLVASCTNSGSTSTPPSSTAPPTMQTPSTTRTAPTSTLPSVPLALVDTRTSRIDRDEVATASQAPVTLIATSGALTVAFSTREAGVRTDTATSISTDGRTWREVASPWRAEPLANDGVRFTTPVALRYAGGQFVALGYRAELVGDRYRSRTVVAASADGLRWALHDISVVPDGDNATTLIRHGGEWLIVADGAEDQRSHLYRSPDANTWIADTTFGFRVRTLSSTPFGIVATGIRRITDNDEVSVVQIARDGRTWKESTGWKPYEGTSIDGVLTAGRGLTVVATEHTPLGPDTAWDIRLLHTDDGTTWTPTPTPKCLVPYAGIGGSGATSELMAILTAREPQMLTVSRDGGITWSCTPLDGPAFAPDVADNGAATINGIADIDGTLTLFGGRAARPGAKPNWNGAVWNVVDSTTTLDHRTNVFRSRLGYTLTVPDRWRETTLFDASDALVGPNDAELLRVRVYDRPNRTSFIDAVGPGPLPNLAQAATQLAREFPAEFGTSPTIRTATIGGRSAWRITPSTDGAATGRVTYLVDFLGGSSRFLEFTIDTAHDAPVIGTLRWTNP